MTRLFRYCLASFGPLGSAGAQFLLSLILLHSLNPRDFGVFSFLLVGSIFSAGLCAALFCAPLLVLVNRLAGNERAAAVKTLFASVLVFCGGAFLVMGAFALLLKAEPFAAMSFAAFVSVYLFRWYARSYAYAIGEQMRTVASDIAYTLVLLAGSAAIWASREVSLAEVYALLLVSAASGLLPFGWIYLKGQFALFSLEDLWRYAPIWKQHSGWALIGILSTEATINCHAYIVTLIAGPAVFAPVAASALLLRPLSVAINALTEFERAQMARLAQSGALSQLRSATRGFRWALIGIWLVTVLAAAGALIYAPGLLFPPKYDLDILVLGAALWMIGGLVNAIRAPEGVLLQAAGQFRPLALASVYSSVISVAGVFTLLLVGGAIWSVGGIVLGNAAFAVATIRFARRWMAARDQDGCAQVPADADHHFRKRAVDGSI